MELVKPLVCEGNLTNPHYSRLTVRGSVAAILDKPATPVSPVAVADGGRAPLSMLESVR